MLHREEPVKVPPSELEDHPVGGLVGSALLLIALDLMVDASRANAAMGQVCSQLGAVILSDHSVPGVEILGDAVCVPKVVLQAPLCRALPALQLEGALGLVLWLLHALAVRQVPPRRHVPSCGLPRGLGERERPPRRPRQGRADLAGPLGSVLEWREGVRDIPQVSSEGQIAEVIEGVPPHLAELRAPPGNGVPHSCVDPQLLVGAHRLRQHD
mmetsp:Transcript_30438/g.90188  ORF Transcript_30438/g.90188 Transcript_30438/m.90188 type:complete len:213 (+) Transcript_30438:690-1328(+)